MRGLLELLIGAVVGELFVVRLLIREVKNGELLSVLRFGLLGFSRGSSCCTTCVMMWAVVSVVVT